MVQIRHLVVSVAATAATAIPSYTFAQLSPDGVAARQAAGRGDRLPPIVTLPRGQITDCQRVGSSVLIHFIDQYTGSKKRNSFEWTKEIADFCNGKGYGIEYPPVAKPQPGPATPTTSPDPARAVNCEGNACSYARMVTKAGCWWITNTHGQKTIAAEITVFGLMGKAVPTLPPGGEARLTNLMGQCAGYSGKWTANFR